MKRLFTLALLGLVSPLLLAQTSPPGSGGSPGDTLGRPPATSPSTPSTTPPTLPTSPTPDAERDSETRQGTTTPDRPSDTDNSGSQSRSGTGAGTMPGSTGAGTRSGGTGAGTMPGASGTSGRGTAPGSAVATGSREETAFLTEAMANGMREILTAQEASQRAQRADVRQFAQMLVDEHMRSNERLNRVARSQGMAAPAEDVASRIDQVKSPGSANFDQEWIRQQVSEHEKSVALFRKQSQSGSNPELQAYARETLPTLEKHLNQLRQMQQRQANR